MALTHLTRKLGGESPTCGRRFLGLASGSSYNDRRGRWFIVWVWGARTYIESAGTGVGNCGGQGMNRGGATVFDSR